MAFLALPPEIRNLIYEFTCYVFEDIIADATLIEPTDTSDHRGPLPSIGLLSVNKQIRAEVLPIIVGINSLRLTDGFVQLFKAPNASPWSQYPQHVKHMVIRFSYRNLFSVYTGFTRGLHQHVQEARGEGRWGKGVDLNDFPSLKTLKMDIEDLYCPQGRCRRRRVVSDMLCIIKAPSDPTVEVHIQGVMNINEREKLFRWRNRHGTIGPKDVVSKHFSAAIVPSETFAALNDFLRSIEPCY